MIYIECEVQIMIQFFVGFIALVLHFLVVCIVFYQDNNEIHITSKEFWTQNLVLLMGYVLCYVIGCLIMKVL